MRDEQMNDFFEEFRAQCCTQPLSPLCFLCLLQFKDGNHHFIDERDAEREVAVYQKAVEANLADFFPATELAAYIVLPTDGEAIAFTAQQIISTNAHKIMWSEGGVKTRLLRIAETVPDCRIEQIERQFRKADQNGCGRYDRGKSRRKNSS